MKIKKYILVPLFFIAAATAATESKDKPAWQMSIDEIKQVTNKTMSGKSLKPDHWPNDAKVAVLFSLDVDNQPEVLSQGRMDRVMMSSREYGARRGVERIVNIFDKYEVPATFFMPAMSLELSPNMGEIIKKSGRHEFAVHGWIHECAAKLTPIEQRELIKASVEKLEKMTGQRPVGFRAPCSSLTDLTMPLLKELGFTYDSSLFADDYPYELNLDGKPSGLVELPPSFNMSDLALTLTDDYAPGLYTPNEVLEQAKDVFDVAYKEGGMMIFVMHPHVSGRPSRAVMLEKLIEYMKTHKDVWFATHRETVEYLNKQ